MSAIYLADWAESGYEGMIGDFNDFSGQIDFAQGCEILLAYYCYEDYSGEAFVLYRKDGQIFEVNGSHCSCYGLEGQWEPEETSVDELMHRINNGQLGTGYGTGNTFAAELCSVLEKVGAA